MVICVTERDYREAILGDASGCILAMALKRVTGHKSVGVGLCRVRLGRSYYSLDLTGTKLVQAFDAQRPIKDFPIQVEMRFICEDRE